MKPCVDPDDGLVCEPAVDSAMRWTLRILAAGSAVAAALLLNALRHCRPYSRRTN